MRALKLMAFPIGLTIAVPFIVASCNANRLDAEYDGFEGGDSDGGEPPRYDLAGRDLRPPRNTDAACASVKAEASLEKKPVDIIFAIDNSGSMSDEIIAVQNNINKSFADIIGKSGLDYRVIMVASHGNATTQQSICISAPLSGNPTCSPVPPRPVNTARFYHYSIEVESTDTFRRLLDSYNGTVKDQYNLSPTGWSAWLRPDSLKVFINITDDRSDMTAVEFERQLLLKTPKMFGDAMNRNYQWNTIAGLKQNTPATKAWEPADPVQTQMCTGSAVYDAAVEYQNLSKLTGGLRFPICQYASFDAVFQRVAMGVISGAKVACDFPVPKPPGDQKIDPDSIIIEYTPGGTGAPVSYVKVASPANCAPGAFYLDKDRIYLCPDACTVVQADSMAKVNVTFDCLSVIG
jgi:hypothetical protein